jgi:hypothetical protein
MFASVTCRRRDADGIEAMRGGQFGQAGLQFSGAQKSGLA